MEVILVGVQIHVTRVVYLYLGQCLAHYIMGSGFIAYAILMAITMLVGERWIQMTGRSPDFFDSCVIMLWVCSYFCLAKFSEPNSI